MFSLNLKIIITHAFALSSMNLLKITNEPVRWGQVVQVCSDAAQRLRRTVECFLEDKISKECIVTSCQNGCHSFCVTFVARERHLHNYPDQYTGVLIAINPDMYNKEQIECAKTQRSYIPSIYEMTLIRGVECVYIDRIGWNRARRFYSLPSLLEQVSELAL